MAKLEDFTEPLLGDLDIALKRTEKEIDALVKGYKSPVFPELSSGGRAKLTINGKTIGAALEVSYSVTANVTEVRTIDQFLPWEIVPGQMMIKASLKRIVDPSRSLGGDGLYSTIQSYLHQPYASLEIRDKLGNVIFYARGMFTDIQGSFQAGQMSVEGVSFIGYYWRENTIQDFYPEPKNALERIGDQFKQNSVAKKFGF